MPHRSGRTSVEDYQHSANVKSVQTRRHEDPTHGSTVESREVKPRTPKDTNDQQSNVAVVTFPEEKGDILLLYCMFISVIFSLFNKTPVSQILPYLPYMQSVDSIYNAVLHSYNKTVET